MPSPPSAATTTTNYEYTHGPFHRVQSPTQSDDVAKLQVESQEIWGRPRRGSDIPQVQAYTGPLPEGTKGIEFMTNAPPDKNLPPGQARWTGPREGVAISDDNEFCKIQVKITKDTQHTSRNPLTNSSQQQQQQQQSTTDTALVDEIDDALVAA